MKAISPSQKVYLAKSAIPNAGRGVFASKDIKMGEIIERCPVIELPPHEGHLLQQTLLINYLFEWGKGVAVCLGFGSIYNHSYEPNATFTKHREDEQIVFSAIMDIGKDEEITVNYHHGNPNDKSPLWIKDIPPAE